MAEALARALASTGPEAIAVHYIENMDAKLMMSLAACRGEGPMAAAPQGDGKWTEYMKAFNGRLYRPDVAPADAPLTEQHRTGRAEANGEGDREGCRCGHAPHQNPATIESIRAYDAGTQRSTASLDQTAITPQRASWFRNSAGTVDRPR